MKKLIIFVTILIFIILSYILIVNKKRSYELEYNFKYYHVIERYEKSINSYLFNIEYNSLKYDFIIQHDYTTKRNIVDNIKVVNNENNCLQITALGVKSSVLCNNGEFYIIKDEELEYNKIKEFANTTIYNKGKFYVWNSYGITSIIDEKKYEIFKSEAYNNSLYYKYDKYLLFADYDSKRNFDKFYVFDSQKKAFSTFELDYEISFDSYFMGDVEGYIYLYDRKNQKQYKINIDKKQIITVSDKNGGQYYDNGWTNVSYNKLNYNELKFNNNTLFNYYIKDKKLYLKYYDSNREILISDKNVTDIISINDDKVYYLVDSAVYMYEYNKGESKLLENFEWNFSYSGKIFIFD